MCSCSGCLQVVITVFTWKPAGCWIRLSYSTHAAIILNYNVTDVWKNVQQVHIHIIIHNYTLCEKFNSPLWARLQLSPQHCDSSLGSHLVCSTKWGIKSDRVRLSLMSSLCRFCVLSSTIRLCTLIPI